MSMTPFGLGTVKHRATVGFAVLLHMPINSLQNRHSSNSISVFVRLVAELVCIVAETQRNSALEHPGCAFQDLPSQAGGPPREHLDLRPGTVDRDLM